MGELRTVCLFDDCDYWESRKDSSGNPPCRLVLGPDEYADQVEIDPTLTDDGTFCLGLAIYNYGGLGGARAMTKKQMLAYLSQGIPWEEY